MLNRRLSILIYHRVLDEIDPLQPGEVHLQQFNEQMKWLKRYFNVLALDEAVEKLESNMLPRRALCITFDDGYKDNYTNALPILKDHDLTATFFISTGFLNDGIMWNDVIIEAIRNTNLKEINLNQYALEKYLIDVNRFNTLDKLLSNVKYLSFEERTSLVQALPDLLEVENPRNLMMTDEEVKALVSQGMTIGAHTVNHPILSRLDASAVKKEINDGKLYLENLINRPVKLLAFPNGRPNKDYTAEHIEIIKELGFKAAVSTAWGAASSRSDIYQLPRFTPWDKSKVKFLARLSLKRFSKTEQQVRQD